ncbi:MAG: hypothetical protein ABIH23_33850 [bacterium]
MISSKNSLIFILAALSLVLTQSSFGQTSLLLSENFDGLTLRPFPSESGGDGTDWTNVPPAGWTVDNSQMGAVGREDWQGWTFANTLAWSAAAEDQRRSEFVYAEGAAAISDPDEWDDVGSPSATGTFNSFLSTPSISLSGVSQNTGVITFLSSWRPEVNQLATVKISFGGGAPVEVLRWVSSPETDPNYKDDNSTNEWISIPFNIPSGSQSMVVTWGLADAGNNWFWAIDNIVIAAGLPSPFVTRTLTTPVFEAGEALPVALNVVLETGSKDVAVMETLPTGWTAQDISDGGQFADGKVTWNLAGFSGSKTLTYSAVASSAAAGDVSISGKVDGVFKIFGDSRLSLIAPVNFFENHLDIGSVGVKGDAVYNAGIDEYELTASGTNIGGTADSFHFVFTEMTGPFSLKGRDLLLQQTYSESAKVGLMVRDSLTAGASHGFAALVNEEAHVFHDIYRPSQGGETKTGSGGVPEYLHAGNVEIERIGSWINFYYYEGEDRVHLSSQKLEDLQDPVFAGLALTSADNGQACKGYFYNVELTQYPFEAYRELPSDTFPWRGGLQGIGITVNVVGSGRPSITVVETPPAGWTVSNAQASIGQVKVSASGVITWTITAARGQATLYYDAASAGDETVAVWSGTATSGDIGFSLPGPSRVFAGAPAGYKTLLSEDFEGLDLGPFVWETGGGDGTDWTKTPPDGWTIDDTGMYGMDEEGVGVPEWKGWSFADVNAWATVAGDQRRTEFSQASGTVAIADPDEWDDQGSPGNGGTFNSYLSTPPIALPETETVILTFDSSWRPEDTQEANLTASFDGGDPVTLFIWSSDANDPNYKDDNSVNDAIFMPISIPAGAQSMVLTFGMYNSTNDWWWAIDNIVVAAEGGDTGEEPLLSVGFDEATAEAAGFVYSQPTGFELGRISTGAVPVGPWTDGQGLTIDSGPGEGVLAIMGSPVSVGEGPVLVSVYVQANGSGCSAGLAALNSVGGSIDGQMGYTISSDIDVPVSQWGRLVLLYDPPNDALQPALQVAVSSTDPGATVFFDNLQVVELPSLSSEAVTLDADGSFASSVGMYQNVNDRTGVVDFLSRPGEVVLSIVNADVAANVGMTANSLQTNFPHILQASIDAQMLSGMGGVTALVMTNANANVGLFVNNSGLPGSGAAPATIMIGGGFEAANPAFPILTVVQNGGPGVTSALLIDNLQVIRITNPDL